MSIQLANRDIRENFRAAVNVLEQNNPKEKVDLDQLTQGFVRSEVTLTVNNSVLTWPIVDTQQISGSPITPTMRLLPEQDSFVVGSLGYWLMTYQMVGGDQSNPDFGGVTGNDWGPITYPSNFSNNGTGVSWSNSAMMFWLGYISVEVNKKVLVPYWDCYRHYKAPYTQEAVGTTSNTWSGYNQKNSIDGGVDAFYPVEPLWVIGGGRQNLIKLNLPSNIPATMAPFSLTGIGYGVTFVAKAVLFFRGIWAQNSTAVR
jgi:hypothetical protein